MTETNYKSHPAWVTYVKKIYQGFFKAHKLWFIIPLILTLALTAPAILAVIYPSFVTPLVIIMPVFLFGIFSIILAFSSSTFRVVYKRSTLTNDAKRSLSNPKEAGATVVKLGSKSLIAGITFLWLVSSTALTSMSLLQLTATKIIVSSHFVTTFYAITLLTILISSVLIFFAFSEIRGHTKNKEFNIVENGSKHYLLKSAHFNKNWARNWPTSIFLEQCVSHTTIKDIDVSLEPENFSKDFITKAIGLMKNYQVPINFVTMGFFGISSWNELKETSDIDSDELQQIHNFLSWHHCAVAPENVQSEQQKNIFNCIILQDPADDPWVWLHFNKNNQIINLSFLSAAQLCEFYKFQAENKRKQWPPRNGAAWYRATWLDSPFHRGGKINKKNKDPLLFLANKTNQKDNTKKSKEILCALKVVPTYLAPSPKQLKINFDNLKQYAKDNKFTLSPNTSEDPLLFLLEILILERQSPKPKQEIEQKLIEKKVIGGHIPDALWLTSGHNPIDHFKGNEEFDIVNIDDIAMKYFDTTQKTTPIKKSQEYQPQSVHLHIQNCWFS